MMRLYADFNSFIDHESGPGQLRMVYLNRIGTLRDLCAARGRLKEGLMVVLYMDSGEKEEIEVDATTHWISTETGNHWVGEFDPKAFRYVPLVKRDSLLAWFPCSNCGTNIGEIISRSGLTGESRCPHCNTQVYRPMAEPDDKCK